MLSLDFDMAYVICCPMTQREDAYYQKLELDSLKLVQFSMSFQMRDPKRHSFRHFY
jgi:hypothetical protein